VVRQTVKGGSDSEGQLIESWASNLKVQNLDSTPDAVARRCVLREDT